jgi:tetratricopeptide (TPR) repeat protein
VAVVALAVVTAVSAKTFVRLYDYNLGQIHERNRQFGLAREAYLRALRRGLSSAGLFNSLGWVEIESGVGSADKAVKYGAKALALRPNDPDVLDTYGWALHHAGRHEEALGYLMRALEQKPRMFCIHYHLAATYLALGRKEDAVRHLRAQIETAPKADETRRAREALERLGVPLAGGIEAPRVGSGVPAAALFECLRGTGLHAGRRATGRSPVTAPSCLEARA